MVAPTGTGVVPVTTGASCATGWFNCAAGEGGGCCPSGYACGVSCTATASGVAPVGKIATGGGEGRMMIGWEVGFLMAAVVAFVL